MELYPSIIQNRITMTEEKLKHYIEERRQGQPHEAFRVPEGYFDTLCDRVMSQLPESQVKTRRVSMLHVWRYAAVALVGALVCSSVLLIPRLKQGEKNLSKVEAEMMYNIETACYDEDYLGEALEYVGIDNNEIALYLTEN